MSDELTQLRARVIQNPDEECVNRYGVDVEYFGREIARLSDSLENRPGEEIARYLRCLADIADTQPKTPALDLDAIRKDLEGYLDPGFVRDFIMPHLKPKSPPGEADTKPLVAPRQWWCESCSTFRPANEANEDLICANCGMVIASWGHPQADRSPIPDQGATPYNSETRKDET